MAWPCWRQGADILDVGGESTRPGAAPCGQPGGGSGAGPAGGRPVWPRPAPAFPSTPAMPAIMRDAVAAAGRSDVINDVTALTGDPESLAVGGRDG